MTAAKVKQTVQGKNEANYQTSQATKTKQLKEIMKTEN